MMKLLSILFCLVFASCGSNIGKLKKVSNEGRVTVFNTALNNSSMVSASLTHAATIAPIVIDYKKIQATSFKKIGTTNYALVTYNYAGDEIHGGLDIIDLSSNVKLGAAFYATNDYEFADSAIKGNIAYVVGQKKNEGQNKAVIVAIDVSNINSLTILSEKTYDGYYATSIEIKDSQAFLTIPGQGVKAVNISNPSSMTDGVFIVPSTSIPTGSIPTGMTVNPTYNGASWGYNYQIAVTNTSSVAISNWKLCFQYNHPVGNGIYNADVSSTSSQPSWVIVPKNYNQIIYPGSNVTLGWGDNIDVGTDRISAIKLLINANASQPCATPSSEDLTYLSSVNRPLFIGLFNNALTTLGGVSKGELVFGTSLNTQVSSSQQEAPTRFYSNAGYLYTNAGDMGLKVINSAKVIVNQSSLSSLGNGISGVGDILMLAQGEQGLLLYDITNKESPSFATSIDFSDDSGSANNISIINISGQNYGLLSDGLAGIKIIKIN